MGNESYQLQLSKGSFNTRITSLEKILKTGSCTECDQPYPADKVESASSEMEFIKNKLNKLSKSIELTETRKRELNKLHDQVLVRRVESEQIRKEIDIHISNMDGSNTESLEPLESTLHDLVASVNTMRTDLTELESEVSNIKYIDSLLLQSSKFRAKVLEKYLSSINTVLASVSPMIFSGMKVSLALDSKASGIDILLSNNGKSMSYKSLSGGQKRRIDVIIVLASQRFLMESSGFSTNLLAFDEIFDSLDAKGVESIVMSLDCLFPESSCIYVITHNINIKSMFNSLIHVFNSEGQSRVEYAIN